MKLWSSAWINGEPIPDRYAAGTMTADGVGFSSNLSPPLAWSDLPAGTASLVLVCHDFDVPSVADNPAVAADIYQPDRELPVDLPRVDFFHWLLVDLAPTVSGFTEGQWSSSFTPRGKPGPATNPANHPTTNPASHPDTTGPARQGLNDYTGWFAHDAAHSGRYFGYDGPFPPFNDALIHHYLFTLYAVDVAQLPVAGDFTGTAVRDALAGHVLGAATLSGTYTLNRRLRGLV